MYIIGFLIISILMNMCTKINTKTNPHSFRWELRDPNAAVGGNLFGAITIILPNGNIVVSSTLNSRWAVYIYNPYNKKLIGGIYGDTGAASQITGITALPNNNFVIASLYDDVNDVVNAGSVRLINGDTGAQIGTTIAGDKADDYLGFTSITALPNNNFVIASRNDDVNGVVDAGSVMLINGDTGAQIGTIAGDNGQDYLGSSSITALPNNNFVIASRNDDVNGVVDAGSVMLINGDTGTQIGTIAGDNGQDYFGSSSITALPNNNFVIASASDDVNDEFNAGSVRLINGDTGTQIGTTIVGNKAYDYLGSSITALPNNNFVIASASDDVNDLVNAGSVRLINGDTGAQIGTTIAGNKADDYLGSSSITALPNNNFVIASPNDDVNDVVNAGSVRQIDTTGTQVRLIVGAVTNDMSGVSIIATPVANFYIISNKKKFVDSGSVSVFDL